jgi:hypothetical protein
LIRFARARPKVMHFPTLFAGGDSIGDRRPISWTQR